MPASSYKKQAKKMTMSKKRLNPGGKLIEGAKCVGSLCGELALGTLKTIEKNMNNEKTRYTFISGLINDILKCLEMKPDVFETFLKEQIEIDDEFVERIMSLATSEGIIKNRLNECFDKSIAKNHTKLKKFLDLNKITKDSDLLHIITILQLLLKKLRLDEVDRVDEFDDYEKRFIYSIMVQFIDPCSVLMGISTCDEDSRFDFFKEWMTYIYPTIDPDINLTLRSSSRKKTKKKKSRKKEKSRKKKKSSKKKRSKKKYSKRKNKTYRR